MSTYKARHLETDKEFERPWILTNPHAVTSKVAAGEPADPAVAAFHKSLPDYNETRLHELKAVASELGLAHLFLKDESTRFGLPAFKILGASWAAHRAIAHNLGLPQSASLEHVKTALAKAKAQAAEVRLVTASEGNWGRAVGRMAKIYGIEATIYVPGFMSEYTQSLLRGEGAVPPGYHESQSSANNLHNASRERRNERLG